jgi:Mg-chelatase subunit ChlD
MSPEKKSLVPSSNWRTELSKATGKPVVAAPAREALVCLLVDRSSSMAGSGKFALARQGAVAFAHDACEKGWHVGLAVFSSEPETVLDPRRDAADQLERSLKNIVPSGSTDMAEAIGHATAMVVGSRGKKAICIATDGEPDDRRLTLAAAEAAKAQGVVIFTIGTEDADKAFLRRLASADGSNLMVASKQLAQGIKALAGLLPKHDG